MDTLAGLRLLAAKARGFVPGGPATAQNIAANHAKLRLEPIDSILPELLASVRLTLNDVAHDLELDRPLLCQAVAEAIAADAARAEAEWAQIVKAAELPS